MNNTKAWIDHYQNEIKELKERLNFDPLAYALDTIDKLRNSGIISKPEAEQAKAELELKKKQIEQQHEIEKLKLQSSLRTQEMQQVLPLLQLFLPASSQQGQTQIQEVKEAYKPIR
jgi:multidrug resistance efflux pump